MKTDAFVEIVRLMRVRQKALAENATVNNLRLCKSLECRVDQYLEESKKDSNLPPF